MRPVRSMVMLRVLSARGRSMALVPLAVSVFALAALLCMTGCGDDQPSGRTGLSIHEPYLARSSFSIGHPSRYARPGVYDEFRESHGVWISSNGSMVVVLAADYTHDRYHPSMEVDKPVKKPTPIGTLRDSLDRTNKSNPTGVIGRKAGRVEREPYTNTTWYDHEAGLFKSTYNTARFTRDGLIFGRSNTAHSLDRCEVNVVGQGEDARIIVDPTHRYRFEDMQWSMPVTMVMLERFDDIEHNGETRQASVPMEQAR